MNKIKILTSIVGLSSLTIGLVPTIASCSCSNKYEVTLVSKTTEREFYKDSGGSAWTFKLTDVEAAANTKVKLVNLKVDGADTTAVAGLMKYSYDSAGNIKVVVKTDTLLTQWPNATKFEFDFEFTNKVTKQTTTFSGFVLNLTEEPVDLTTPLDPCLCPWDIIINRSDACYAGTITPAQLAASFYNGDPTSTFTSLDQLIGLQREVTINNKVHKVRIIGAQHATDLIVKDDGTVTDTPALLTFELVTILSDSSGNAIVSQWGSTNNYDYTNSILRANLNGGSTKTFTTPIVELLPSNLQTSIKTVQKQVSTTSDYTITTYNDKLFPLTCTEMAHTSPYVKQEGSAYTYWTNNDDFQTYKKDVNGNINKCWLTSPMTLSDSSAWTSPSSVYTENVVTNTRAVSFAFCI